MKGWKKKLIIFREKPLFLFPKCENIGQWWIITIGFNIERTDFPVIIRTLFEHEFVAVSRIISRRILSPRVISPGVLSRTASLAGGNMPRDISWAEKYASRNENFACTVRGKLLFFDLPEISHCRHTAGFWMPPRYLIWQRKNAFGKIRYPLHFSGLRWYWYMSNFF